MRDLETIRECKQDCLQILRLMTNWCIPKAKDALEKHITKLDEWEKESGTQNTTKSICKTDRQTD